MNEAGRSVARIAVIGGGPAGMAVALVLARLGATVTIFEADRLPRAKLGETLSPNAMPIIDALNLHGLLDKPNHMAALGDRSSWGSTTINERHFIQLPFSDGWRLDRRVFEADLAQQCREIGVLWYSGTRCRTVSRTKQVWRLCVDTDGTSHGHTADFLVDGSGRRAFVARQLGARRISYDRLVGVAVRLPLGFVKDAFTLVESTPTGWWYSALLASGELIVSYFTDHDLPDSFQMRQPDGWWGMLNKTGPTWERVREHGSRPPATVQVLPAASTRLTQISGPGWLAIGDAATAFDPLSSHGIAMALAGGYRAAHVIIKMQAGIHGADSVYVSQVDGAYTRYQSELRNCYQAETRWTTEPFWARRLHDKFGTEPIKVERETSVRTKATE